jgi:hypothetical protein
MHRKQFTRRSRRAVVTAASLATLILALGPVSSALAMNGNFDSPLNLMMSGKKVDAHGPISWDADEASATITITVTQGSVSATRTATYSSSASSWHLTLTAASGSFHSGAATGSGSAVVNLGGGGTETYAWSSPITLN